MARQQIKFSGRELDNFINEQASRVIDTVKRSYLNEAWFGAESNYEVTYKAICELLGRMAAVQYIDSNLAQQIITTFTQGAPDLTD